jgi:hypothetical protein
VPAILVTRLTVGVGVADELEADAAAEDADAVTVTVRVAAGDDESDEHPAADIAATPTAARPRIRRRFG